MQVSCAMHVEGVNKCRMTCLICLGCHGTPRTSVKGLADERRIYILRLWEQTFRPLDIFVGVPNKTPN